MVAEGTVWSSALVRYHPGNEGFNPICTKGHRRRQDPKDPAGISSAHPIVLGNKNAENVIGPDRRKRFHQCIILGWLIAVIGIDL